MIGVHAGCCVDGKDTGELPRSHPEHRKFIEYHDEMIGEGRGEALHFFTNRGRPRSTACTR